MFDMNRAEIKQLLSRTESWIMWSRSFGWSAESWRRWCRFNGAFDYNFVERLVPLLRHQKIQFRWRAANCLGAERYPKAVSELEKCLEDPSWLVRLHSAKALGRIHHNSSIAALIAHRNDLCPFVRRRIITALGAYHHEPSIVPYLIEALLGDEDRKVRYRASAALSGFAGSGLTILETLDNLPSYASDDPYFVPRIIYAAFQKINKISKRQLITFLSSDDGDIRRITLQLFLKFPSGEVHQSVRTMLEDPLQRRKLAETGLEEMEVCRRNLVTETEWADLITVSSRSVVYTTYFKNNVVYFTSRVDLTQKS